MEQWETRWTDYYDIVGIEICSNKDQIIDAINSLIKKYHPDLNTNESQIQKKQFNKLTIQLNEAKHILTDDIRRKYYDKEWKLRHGSSQPNPSPPKPPPPPPPKPPSPPKPSPDVKTIIFDQVEPNTYFVKTFNVTNIGGPYSRYHIDFDEESDWYSIESNIVPSNPKRINISVKAKGLEWGKTYLDTITINFINFEANTIGKANVDLKVSTKPKPLPPPPKPISTCKIIDFDIINPLCIHAIDFYVKNIGGPYTYFEIKQNQNWYSLEYARIPKDTSSNRVVVEVKVPDWDRSYSDTMTIMLINEATGQKGEMKVEIKCKSRKRTADDPADSGMPVYVKLEYKTL